MRLNEEVNVTSAFDEAEIEKRITGMNIEFVPVKSVKESEYAESVKELAVADNYARRAARDKFQRKSALIMLIDGEFAGFGIFETDNRAKQFYIWQIAISDAHKGKGLGKVMVEKMLNENKKQLPAVVTVYDKNEISLGLFKSCGFEPYQKKGTVYYMTRGGVVDGVEIKASDVARIKRLLGINPTNIWNSAKGDWRLEKQKWNELIENAGMIAGVNNPTFASREGCWQKDGGLAKFATGNALNEGASVLDPFVCELVLKLFMPKAGASIYNPFAGGIQMGFVSGFYGYEYLGTEIRQNQCDANNDICKAYQMEKVNWVKADSSTYFDANKKFDMVFTCPPYYLVEDYRDYDGVKPDKELNGLDTYEKFRDMLFKGYENAIKMLNDNCFFAIMVGDSRDKNGAYYGAESDTEVFLRDQGLHLYNRIIYLETQFTRAMQTKATIKSRKLPKCDQKIIVAYKGNPNNINALYEDIGRI
jgi:ribosomal protein S18 acetylase RimI-like enzyme